MNRVSGRTGRPTKLTPEVHDTIVDALRKGNYLETACGLAGIKSQSARNWMHIGSNPRLRKDGKPFKEDERYVRFFHDAKKAMAEAEEEDLEAIREAPEWTARAWRLERRFPDRWAKRTHRTEEDDGMVGELLDRLDDLAAADARPYEAPE